MSRMGPVAAAPGAAPGSRRTAKGIYGDSRGLICSVFGDRGQGRERDTRTADVETGEVVDRPGGVEDAAVEEAVRAHGDRRACLALGPRRGVAAFGFVIEIRRRQTKRAGGIAVEVRACGGSNPSFREGRFSRKRSFVSRTRVNGVGYGATGNDATFHGARLHAVARHIHASCGFACGYNAVVTKAKRHPPLNG